MGRKALKREWSGRGRRDIQYKYVYHQGRTKFFTGDKKDHKEFVAWLKDTNKRTKEWKERIVFAVLAVE